MAKGRAMDGFAMALLVVLILATVFRGEVELVIPRACMERVELSERSECYGPDERHLKCTGLVLKVRKECEQLRVVKR